MHVVSLNPENLVLADENPDFMQAIQKAYIKIIDGFGVIFMANLCGITYGQRYAGVDLMSDLLKEAEERRLRVMLIGGRPNIAEEVAKCQNEIYPRIEFSALEGITDISNVKKSEEAHIFSIVTATKPHLVFVAFGSPFQELWIDRHSNQFGRCTIIGVGGAFDFLSGIIPRAPLVIQRIGLEWLFRLLLQPWRFGRQLRLIKFIWLAIKERVV